MRWSILTENELTYTIEKRPGQGFFGFAYACRVYEDGNPYAIAFGHGATKSGARRDAIRYYRQKFGAEVVETGRFEVA